MKLNNIVGACDKVDEIFDQLEIQRDGRIDPDAEIVDEDKDSVILSIKVISAIDLQICDWNSSDPFVTVSYKGVEFERTSTKFKTLNPVWNEQLPEIVIKNSTDDQYAFLKFKVMDYDDIPPNDLCGEAEQIYVRNDRFKDFLKHDETLKLSPQGKLFLRITRLGHVNDPDFFVRKAAEAVNTAVEDMLHIYMDVMTSFVKKIIEGIIKKVASEENIIDKLISFGNNFGLNTKKTGKEPESLSDDQIETLLEPLFAYLNTNLGLFNETLDPRLGEFIERTPSLLGNTPGTKTRKNQKGMFFKKSNEEKKTDNAGANSSSETTDQSEDERPNPIIKLLWRRIVLLMYQELSTYGAGANSQVKADRKNNRIEAERTMRSGTGDLSTKWGPRMASLPSFSLTDSEKRAVVVYDIVLEYLKSFFHCEIDGVAHGFGVEELEGEEYEKLKNFIVVLQQKVPSLKT
ncbi:hypothetical protein HK096_009623 [Nowakowskiella sp. JEL0078]|nr:hypothetical protein HK096_009623 [Nowakowskiella sp. JEL0078]